MSLSRPTEHNTNHCNQHDREGREQTGTCVRRQPSVAPRPQPPVPGRYAWWDLDWPHRPTLVFPAHFVLTFAHRDLLTSWSPILKASMFNGSTSQLVTHPQIAPSQARLTLRFLLDGLPKKKEFLVDMSSLSIIPIKPGSHTLVTGLTSSGQHLCPRGHTRRINSAVAGRTA